jgi:hypothetical protein
MTSSEREPPSRVECALEEALDQPHSRMVETCWWRRTTWRFWPRWITRFSCSTVDLGWTKEDLVADELLRASKAARRLDLSTKELLRLIHDRRIRHVMVDGMAHVPVDALEQYRTRAS